MTLAEKIGQMTLVAWKSISAREVTARGIGALLSGGSDSPRPNTAEGCHAPLFPYGYGLDVQHKSAVRLPDCPKSNPAGAILTP